MGCIYLLFFTLNFLIVVICYTRKIFFFCCDYKLYAMLLIIVCANTEQFSLAILIIPFRLMINIRSKLNWIFIAISFCFSCALYKKKKIVFYVSPLCCFFRASHQKQLVQINYTQFSFVIAKQKLNSRCVLRLCFVRFTVRGVFKKATDYYLFISL